MPSRTATIASALALATAALAAGAPPAAASDFCNTTTGGPFDGTTICVSYGGPLIAGYYTVPFSVGSICVGSACTTPVYGQVDVPIPNLDLADVYGQVCVPYKSYQICVPFTTNLPIAIQS